MIYEIKTVADLQNSKICNIYQDEKVDIKIFNSFCDYSDSLIKDSNSTPTIIEILYSNSEESIIVNGLIGIMISENISEPFEMYGPLDVALIEESGKKRYFIKNIECSQLEFYEILKKTSAAELLAPVEEKIAMGTVILTNNKDRLCQKI